MYKLRHFRPRRATPILVAIALTLGPAAASAFQVSNNSETCVTVELSKCIPKEKTYKIEPDGQGAQCIQYDTCNGECSYKVYAGCSNPPSGPAACEGNISSGLSVQVNKGPSCQ